jgi:hypothetical protein
MAVEGAWPSEAEQGEALAALALYGVAPHEREVPRVRLAIVKLSAGQIGRVRDLVKQAKQDYRDVLMWAEYPEEGQSLWTTSAPKSAKQQKELAAIRQRDLEQHARWLTELRRRTMR